MSETENLKTLCFVKKTKLLKNGEAPIFIRVTLGHDRAEFGIKKSVLPKLWDDTAQRVKKTSPTSSEINTMLDNYLLNIKSIVDYLKFTQDIISPQEIINKIHGKKEQRRTILQVFGEHNAKTAKLLGIDYAKSTVQRYETCYAHTQDFIRWKFKRDDYPLDQLNQQFIKDYEFYLKTERKCNHNSATKYLKNLKKIVRIALANNWLTQDPFATIQFKYKPVDAVFLSEVELEQILKKEIKIERLALVKDIFVFCCFTGLAFSDVKGLKKEHLSTDKEGFLWINKRREKNNQMSTIFVIDGARRIIEKYKNHPVVMNENLVLPVLSNQKMNGYLKEIADICGVQKSVTTHTARHTFATTVALGNNIPIEVVSKTIGHSSIKMTQRYARTTETLIKKNMEKIDSIY